MPPGNSNKEMETARLMLGQHLRRGALASSTAADAFVHPDDDAVNAFIEGRLNENESLPLISHFVACAACRRMMVELIRFTTEIEPSTETPTPNAEQSTSRIRRLLQELAARVLPSSNDDAVFAYQAQANESASGKAEANPQAEDSLLKENDSPENSSDKK
jgi:hypothetical protein